MTEGFYLDTSVIVAPLTDDALHTRADRFFRIGFSLLDAWSARSATRVEISAVDVAVAETLLRRIDPPLQAPDAIHIAIAQRINATLVTFDRQMEAGARALGMTVAMP